MTLTADNQELKEKLIECQDKINYSFDNIKLLEKALTHTSFKTLYNPSNED